MINNPTHLNMINSNVREIYGAVLLCDGSTNSSLDWYSHDNYVQSIEIERVGESKFFGYGYNQKLNVKILDKDITKGFINTSHYFRVCFDVKGSGVAFESNLFPSFYVSEVHRDENTGTLSITAYDGLKGASAHTIAELGLQAPYTIRDVAETCATFLGFSEVHWIGLAAPTLSFEEGANLEGTETLREVLNAIAEVTQSIYYVNHNNHLIFKRLDRDGGAIYNLTKDNYITLDSKTNRRLQAITSATDLGDNVTASIDAIGSTQYVRNNPFWELRDDVDVLLQDAIDVMGGMSINQFECSWRGNYLLEIGDKLAIVTKDSSVVYSYLLNDSLTYDGSLSQKTEWQMEEDEAETATNSNTLGEVLKETYARVDKANKQIEIVTSEAQANKDAIASIQLNTEEINISMQKMEQQNKEIADGIEEEIATLTEKVNLAITEEQLTIAIQSELDNGVTKVATNTGFTFDDTGLTVSKENSEMSTTITEDGMTVFKDNTEMLIANNQGVNAVNLHATTYLIIGNNSRLEDYDGIRTGCFWIGGN